MHDHCFWQRLFTETQDEDLPPRSGDGINPLTERQRGQSEGGQQHSPHLGNTSDDNNCSVFNQHHDCRGDRTIMQANSVAARALAALEDDCDSENDRNGSDQPSPLLALKISRAPSAPQSGSHVSSPPRKVQRRHPDNWGDLKHKIQNYNILHSPASSAASSKNSARLRSLAIKGTSASSNNVHSSSKNSINSQNSAGRTVLGPRNAGRAVIKNAALREIKLASSQNGDRPLSKVDEICSPLMNEWSAMAGSDQKLAYENPGGPADSSKNGVIDLTEDELGDGVRPPMKISNNQFVCDQVEVRTSAKSQENETKKYAHERLQEKTSQTENKHVVNHNTEQANEDVKRKNASSVMQEKCQERNDILNCQETAGNDSNNCVEPQMPTPQKENNDRSANHHVVDHTPDKQQNNETESNEANLNNAGSNKSAHTPKTKSKNASARRTSPTRKAPAKKSSVGVLSSCSLVGTLSSSEKDGNRAHIIRGLWEYDNQAESAPQRFELRCLMLSGEEHMPLITGGIFNGHLVYQWVPKGKLKTSLVIKENDVDLSFIDQDGELQVKGAGRNDFGRFDLVGTGKKLSTQDLYNVQLTKIYTELFPSRVPQPGHDEIEDQSVKNDRKSKFSSTESSESEVSGNRLEEEKHSSREGMLSGSETSSSDQWEGVKQLLREGELPRAITMPTRKSNSSQESERVDMADEVARNNGEGDTSAVSIKRGGKTFFDLVRAEVVCTTTERGERYEPVPMSLPQSKKNCTSDAFSGNNGSTMYESWQECGAFERMDHSINGFTISWNVRNVKRKYSQMNLDFFDSVGIVNVQDLLEADENELCSRLMAFDKFKAACAFATWRSNMNNRTSSNGRQGRTFRDLYRIEFAKKSILTWKEAAESWSRKIAQANDKQNVDVVSEMGEVSVENQAESNGTRDIGASSETEEDNSDASVQLERILSAHETFALKKYCGIRTAQQLLAADGKDLKRRLTGFVGISFGDRTENEVKCIVEGMMYSWMLRTQEVLQVDESTTVTLSSAPPADEDENVGVIPTESGPAFKTPLSYFECQFIRSQHILSDEQLANSDCALLARRFVAYMLSKMRKKIPAMEAVEIIYKWRQDARSVLDLNSGGEIICNSLPKKPRLGKDSGTQEMMNTVANLCRTVADEENEGLPKRTIFTYDRSNNVLYEFVASVKNSMCSPDAGKGAFLTYIGAKVLKASSMWKKKEPRDIPSMAQTRKPLEATFPTSGATVTVTGSNIHADERHYGPENDKSVGLYNEFTLDDFVDTEDNITFSSKHLGCALIELESRYAPLLPIDRKTDQLFSVKDFIFSHEPSSWRFDVPEELNGHPQVVDFTDDTTGAPHDVARAHMSMYVNEVGHNMNLVENVSACCPSPRAVTYYIDIDKPMAKGESVELLVNYKDHYEAMRERRGYGKANILDGVKSDAHGITRVQRNLKDRFLVEASIMQFTEDEICEVMDFFKTRVWDGVKAATSTFEMSDKEGESNLLRQCIARRRMCWLSTILRTRFQELLGRRGPSSLPPRDGSDSEECIFQPGMFVFVNGWPTNNPRPAYTGIATITSISKNKWNRNVFVLSLSDGKYIESVPEAVVTVPTHDDFDYAAKRTYSNWIKWKKQEDLPRLRLKLLKGFDNIKWDPSFVWNIPVGLASGSSFETQANIFQSLQWELSEELLFILMKNKRLSDPFDEKVWCPLSVSLLTKCLHLIADFLLMGRDKEILCKAFMGLARDTANTMKNIINESPNASHVENLAFVDKSNKQVAHVLITEAVHVNMLAVEDYLNEPQALDLDWYLIHQVILAVHPLASLIDWGPSPGTENPIYSIEKMSKNVGLGNSPYLNFYTPKVEQWRPLVCK